MKAEDLRIKPIKLTEEWLVKFGFVDYGDGFFAMKNPIDFSVDLKDANVSWVNQIYSSGYCHHTLPEYVHQLQNLYFALTGEEL